MKNCGKYQDNLNLVGSILKQKRLEQGLSLEALSSKLLLLGINIPVTSLHRIENNQRTVRDYEIYIVLKIIRELSEIMKYADFQLL